MAETDVRSRQPIWTFGCRLGQAEGAVLTYEANGVVHCAYHFCSKDAVCGISSSALISSSAFSPALYYSHEELLAGDPVPPEGRARGIAAEAELEVGGVCCGGVEACVDVVLGDVPDAPNLADPAFQQLLVDVQSVKVCLPPRAAPLTATLHRAQ